MIFQLLLIVALSLLVVYAYSQLRNAPVISVSVLALGLGAIVLAIDPDLATKLARSVGVGRGADLILYCFILISLVAIFNLHLRFRAGDQDLTKVVRALALLTARQPPSALAAEMRDRHRRDARSPSPDAAGRSADTADVGERVADSVGVGPVRARTPQPREE